MSKNPGPFDTAITYKSVRARREACELALAACEQAAEDARVALAAAEAAEDALIEAEEEEQEEQERQDLEDELAP